MRRYLSLFGAFFRQHLKLMLEHRMNFMISLLGTIFWQGACIAAIVIVMDRVPVLKGWTRDEIFLTNGLLTLGLAVARMLDWNLLVFGQAFVQNGRLDRLLVRPMNPLFHLIADRFNQEGVGDFIVGMVLVVRSIRVLNLTLSPVDWLYLVMVVVSGAGIFLALQLAAATLAFWVTIATPINLAVGHFTQFAQYPLSIYAQPVRVFLTWLLPFGLASFYPAEYLLGHNPGPIAFAVLPMAAFLFFLAYRFWSFGLRRYSGTGS